MTGLTTTDWTVLAKLALPYFGNDLDRVVGEVDVRRLIALAHVELDDPDDTLLRRVRKAREQELVLANLREIKA